MLYLRGRKWYGWQCLSRIFYCLTSQRIKESDKYGKMFSFVFSNIFYIWMIWAWVCAGTYCLMLFYLTYLIFLKNRTKWVYISFPFIYVQDENISVVCLQHKEKTVQLEILHVMFLLVICWYSRYTNFSNLSKPSIFEFIS